MKCFLCLQHFPSVKPLILHMRYKHSFEDGPIKCMEDGCFRDCTNTNSFRKHCREKHKTSNYYTEKTNLNNVNHNDDDFDHSALPIKK